MKRLMFATALLLATTSISVWAQAPAANDQQNPTQTAMPMAGCPGAAMSEGQKANCPMAAPGDAKSDQGSMSTQKMMQDMMNGQMHGHQHGDHGSKNCCELSKADKPK